MYQRSVNEYVDMDKIQDVISLVMNKKNENAQSKNTENAEAVYIKGENAESESSYIFDKSNVKICHVRPVLDVAEEISVNDIIIEQVNRKGIEANIVDIVNDPTENEQQDTNKRNNTEVLVKFAASRRNPIKFKVVNESVDNLLPEKSYDYPALKDGQDQMHLVKYMKVENKIVKIWECGFCSKEFRHRYALTRHLPTHTGERNFTCEICGKAFRHECTRSQHRAIHADARPYVCKICKKTFNRLSTLISHCKTHSDHKCHKCSTCGMGFHQKGNLRNHIFTHTNERPYKCDLCGNGFNQMSNLRCHKSRIHGKTSQNICYISNIEFSCKNDLCSHEEYKHGKITVPPRVSGEKQGSVKLKFVPIKVPVVATVTQVVAPDGSLKIQVEPPAPENYLLNGSKEDEPEKVEEIAIKPEMAAMEEKSGNSPDTLEVDADANMSAGYQVRGDDEKIVITATDSEVVAEDIIEQEIEYADGSHVILESDNGEVLIMHTAESSPP